ncbi:gamma-glutamyltransferase [Novosphingobium sp. Gsoil 351]|uniref:gamma-glutamyltransferase n=1 Tax=Novosphingobium sp. Gsoil 351 TaxID=2675225 RepID=UPI0012B45D1C|nr:gamma-glutamyltransferase [Novosphingobium sp. Gsoil 351]QGN55206.1 gamma-glutamyltransferase [Novosphingobium sp. Gsoil 351]
MSHRLLIPFAALALSACATLPATTTAPPRIGQLDSATAGAQGIVSAADPRASQAGAEMLRAGGTATDAAIATMLALTVVEPQSSGIGGGGFLVRGDPNGAVTTYDGRENAPAAANPEWFFKDGKPMSIREAIPGGRSVGVPGSIRMAALAHRQHGKLPWKRLFGPAIRLARDGFAVTPRLHEVLAEYPVTGAYDAEGRDLFYNQDGTAAATGRIIRNPALADFLTELSEKGPGAFYTGQNPTAATVRINQAPTNPAPTTPSDFAAYQAKERQPLCGAYRGYRICGMGPPSSGATTVYATLKQLERFDLGALGKDSPVAWHLIAESERLAYADRGRYLGDGDFVAVPAAGLMDPAYLASRSALIDPARTLGVISPGTPPGAQALSWADPATQPENGTSHFVAVDKAGSAVSYTSTIESIFGSGLVVNGYYLNNELTDFNLAPSDANGRPTANRVEAGKRPRSSMAPTLVYGPDGALRLAIGAAGGATIPAQVLKAIIGVIDWKLSAQDAIALPVIFAPEGDTVFVEKGSALEAMIPALVALGHKSVIAREPSFKANAIERVGNRWIGAADPRSEGAAVAE